MNEPDSFRMRASDADRDQVADQLREALAEGRITPEEHAERIDGVYAAKTYAELAPLVADLPPAEETRPGVDLRKPGQPLPEPVREGGRITVIFGGAERRGRWLVEPSTDIFALCGGVELDFRRAVLSQREVTVNISCIFAGVQIVVPPGVRVVNAGSAIFGGWRMPDDEPINADAPVIRLTGFCLMGGVDVKYAEQAGDRRGRRRDERRDHLRVLRHARREHRRRGH